MQCLPVPEYELSILPGPDAGALVRHLLQADVDSLPHPGLEPFADPAARQLAHACNQGIPLQPC